MLTYEDYQLINSLKQNDPQAYKLTQKIACFSLESTSHACHDLRNYAALIDNYCQLLALSCEDIKDNPYFQKINQNTRQLISLFDQISQFRYSFREDILKDCNLADYVNCAVQKVCAEYHFEQSEIEFQYDPTKEYLFTCKNSGFLDAIIALLQNAIEACDPDDTSIQIILTEQEQQYCLVIQDNGSGFSDEMMEKGISPFESEKSKHFGLGLSTAAILILKNDGNIHIRNRDRGSEVTITLPKIKS